MLSRSGGSSLPSVLLYLGEIPISSTLTQIPHSQHFWHEMYEFIPTPTSSLTSWIPTVQFSPDLMDWMEPTRLLCLCNSPVEIARAGCISSSRGSSPSRDWTWVSCIVDRFFPAWATREAHLRGISINSHTLRAWSHRLTLLQTPIASSSLSLVFLTNWL